MYNSVYDNYFCFQAIAGIAESWEQITLDIGPYKDRGHFRLKCVLTIQHKQNINKLINVAGIGLVTIAMGLNAAELTSCDFCLFSCKRKCSGTELKKKNQAFKSIGTLMKLKVLLS